MENFIRQLAKEHFETHRQAFAHFIRSSFPLCHEEIANIYSDVWIDVIENVRRGRTERVKNWKTYIFSIGWKKACKLATRRQKTEQLDFQDNTLFDFQAFRIRAAEEDSTHMMHLEKIEDAMTELARLPEKQRAVVELYYLKGMSTAEIAEAMGYSGARSVITIKKRSIDVLRKKLACVA